MTLERTFLIVSFFSELVFIYVDDKCEFEMCHCFIGTVAV